MAATSSSTFSRWCRVTAYHGVLDCYLAKNKILKAIWFTVVITGCFLAISHTVDFILDYAYEDNWITNEYRITPPDDLMEWPDITICYADGFDARNWKRFGPLDPYEMGFLTHKERGVDFHHQYFADPQEPDLQTTINLARSKVLFSTESQSGNEDTGPWQQICEDTVIQCGTNDGFRFEVGCDCTQYGMPSTSEGCFVMNLTEIKRLTDDFYNSGYESGVQLLLNPQTDTYYPAMLYGGKLTSGFKLYVHFNGEENEKYSTPILAGSGMHVLISMQFMYHRTTPKRTYTFRFHTPKPPCVTRFEYKWLNTTYSSRTLCRQDCFTEFAVESCRCVSTRSAVPLKVGYNTCNETEEETCQRDINTSRKNKTILPSGFNLSHCFGECRELCEHRAVNTDVSLAPFPVASRLKSFTKYLNKASTGRRRNYTEDDVRQMVLLELFYESKEYKMVERVVRVSLEDLISNIGGTLGVWTGLSLISIFQAFMFIAYSLEGTLRRAADSTKRRVAAMTTKQYNTQYNLHSIT